MTAPFPPELDELVSAYLDGEATADQVARIEAEPALLARADELRQVRSLFEDPVTINPATKEAHLSSALDVFDEMFANTATLPTAAVPAGAPIAAATAAETTATSPPTSPAAEPVVSLDRERERRRPRRLNMIAAIAAAVALLFGLIAFGLNAGSGDDVATDAADTAASVAESRVSGDDAGDAASSSAAFESAPAADADVDAMADDAMADEEEAMEEEAMADEEDAMEEEAAELDSAAQAVEAPELAAGDDDAGTSADAADEAADAEADFAPPTIELPTGGILGFYGSFPDESALSTDLEANVAGLADLRQNAINSAADTQCPDLILDITGSGLVLVLAIAEVDGRQVEITELPAGDEAVIIAIDTCTEVGRIALGAP